MNLKDFGANANQKEKAEDSKKSVKDKFQEIKDTPEFKQVENEYGDFVKDFVNDYANRSEAELMQELLKLISQKKAEGTFDASKIKQLAEVIRPMLDEEQQSKMSNLLTLLD